VLGSLGLPQLVDSQLPFVPTRWALPLLVLGPAVSESQRPGGRSGCGGSTACNGANSGRNIEMRLKSRRASLTRVPRLAGGPHPITTTDPGWQFAEHPTTLSIFDLRHPRRDDDAVSGTPCGMLTKMSPMDRKSNACISGLAAFRLLFDLHSSRAHVRSVSGIPVNGCPAWRNHCTLLRT